MHKTEFLCGNFHPTITALYYMLKVLQFQRWTDIMLWTVKIEWNLYVQMLLWKREFKNLQENTSRRKRKTWIHHTWYVVVLQLQKQILWQQVIFYFLLTITIYQLSVEWSPIIEEKQNANVVSTLIWIRPVIWVLLCAVISKKAASKWPTSQFNWISLKLWKCINYSWTRFSVRLYA